MILVILTINIIFSRCKEYFPIEIVVKNIQPCKIQKRYLICAWNLSLNEGNYAIIIDGGRQKDRQTDKVSYREAPLRKIKCFSNEDPTANWICMYKNNYPPPHLNNRIFFCFSSLVYRFVCLFNLTFDLDNELTVIKAGALT